MSGRKKVTIVGGGQTGGIMAYRLAEKNICDIVIKDVAEYAQHHGKALDIMQGGPFAGFETRVTATDEWAETANSDVVVITSGAPRKPGMSREDAQAFKLQLEETLADVSGVTDRFQHEILSATYPQDAESMHEMKTLVTAK